MQCSICISTILKTQLVSCPSCEYISCKECLKKYFEEILEPKCPSCSVILTREFIFNNFKSFKKQYNNMRQKFLYQQELSLIPDTQFLAENELQARDIDKTIETLLSHQKLMQQQLRNLIIQIDTLRTDVINLRNLKLQASEPSSLVVCKCPNCMGFIKSTNYECGLCNTKICKMCTLVTSATHVCNEDDVKSAKLIKADSKKCPKCSCSIFKIDGCDQMWCTQCQTAFSWKTNRIITDRVHNPHFYEWQRQNMGQEIPRADECDGGFTSFRAMVRMLPPYTEDNWRYLLKIDCMHRFIGEINDTVRRVDRVNNVDIRVSYMLNEMTKESFTKILNNRDIVYQKKNSLRDIFDVLNSEVEHIFRTIANATIMISDDLLVKYCERIDNVVNFINNSLYEIFVQFGGSGKSRYKKVTYVCTYQSFPNTYDGLPKRTRTLHADYVYSKLEITKLSKCKIFG